MALDSKDSIAIETKTEDPEALLGNPPDEDALSKQAPSSSEPFRYTTFTRNQLRLLTLLLGLITITSPLTATIYFPLMPLLRSHFHTSAQAINLTITIYIVFQAISPAIFGPLSDSLGRRPVYLFTLLLYVAGSLGLALNKSSLAVLIVLRALQSLGASATQSITYGVVADVCIPSARGGMNGPVSMTLNLGTCIGPVIGGLVAYTSGSYEWVFYALVMIGAVLLAMVILFLPETARIVVGNGSGRDDQSWIEDSVWTMVKNRRQKRKQDTPTVPAGVLEGKTSIRRTPLLKRIKIKNPLACLRVIFHYDTFLALWMHGSFYTVDYAMVAATPDIYKTIYHFNELQIGLSYLPRGVGIIAGGYCNGKLMDYNYKTVARNIGWKVDKISGDDLKKFPIERARSRGVYWLLLISTATLIGYGWVVKTRAHFSILLVLQFIQGFWGTCFYTIFNTLLVDIFPESPATASASASIVRCAMAATGVAILQPLLSSLGRGWYFTILGLWSGGFGVAAVLLIRWKGMQWRIRRLEKELHP
ncbi:Itaconate transport protein [Lachnellula cervina]|uniref:Itaconate transport protein n=1 Tax=Lachnellula cervina TaxID=1316786 RepID=A0A7D8YPA1_9HELO|nr:Itaconate transport protein [Lachnellula cervina]